MFFKMTSVCGHVMALNFTGAFNNWDTCDPVKNSHHSYCTITLTLFPGELILQLVFSKYLKN